MVRFVLVVGLIAVLVSFHAARSAAWDEKARRSLDAVLRVIVEPKTLAISCQFDLPGKEDQGFTNTEYRYWVLDKDGVEIKEAYLSLDRLRTIRLPKGERSVTDASDAGLIKHKLNKGEEHYLVITVRNRTGLAKFKVE